MAAVSKQKIRMHLINTFQEDCRKPYAEISKKLGVDVSVLSRTWKEMREEGLVIAERAILNAGRLGCSAICFVRIRQRDPQDQEQEWRAKLIHDLTHSTHISELHRLSVRPLELLAKWRAFNASGIDMDILNLEKDYPVITEAIFSIETLKETTMVPLLEYFDDAMKIFNEPEKPKRKSKK